MSYTYEHPHPAVAIDCVVFGFNGKELELLLIKRGIAPFKGAWAFPGGFMRMDETAEEGAERELMEETGLTVQTLKQLGAFSSVHRDPRERVVSIAFYALVKPGEVNGGDDADRAQWFHIDEAPPLAFDHDYILRKALQQLRKDIHFEPVGFDLLDQSFTMSELQRLYESILGVRFDRRNFEKKMLQTGILQLFDEDEEVFPEQEICNCYYSSSELENSFYGSKHEMKTKDIDDLFSIISPSETTAKKKPGRKGRKWVFNKDKYDSLKQDNSFKLEF